MDHQGPRSPIRALYGFLIPLSASQISRWCQNPGRSTAGCLNPRFLTLFALSEQITRVGTVVFPVARSSSGAHLRFQRAIAVERGVLPCFRVSEMISCKFPFCVGEENESWACVVDADHRHVFTVHTGMGGRPWAWAQFIVQVMNEKATVNLSAEAEKALNELARSNRITFGPSNADFSQFGL